jgi:general secretion pathway protein K
MSLRFPNKLLKRSSGMILLTVLWILMILAALAMSLSRQASIDVALTKQAVGKVQSKYQAWAGVMYAVDLIRQDSEDEKTGVFDSLYLCGIPEFEEKSLSDIFINESEGLQKDYFKIVYRVFAGENQPGSFQPGLADEERRININALNQDNRRVFEYFLNSFEIDEKEAENIAAAVIDWKDEDDVSLLDPNQKEEEFKVDDKSYPLKNRPFSSLDELRLVEGITEKIFKKIKEHLTIYPASGNFVINFDAAPASVLKAAARSFAGAQTNTDIADADSLVEKMLERRRGNDGVDGSVDDQLVEWNDLALNAKEQVIAFSMHQYRIKRSEYLRVVSQGVAPKMGVTTTVEAVIRRSDLAIVEWNRN